VCVCMCECVRVCVCMCVHALGKILRKAQGEVAQGPWDQIQSPLQPRKILSCSPFQKCPLHLQTTEPRLSGKYRKDLFVGLSLQGGVSRHCWGLLERLSVQKGRNGPRWRLQWARRTLGILIRAPGSHLTHTRAPHHLVSSSPWTGRWWAT
jgi:hypothetical protein